jgi:hypothetical protein
MLSNCKRRSNAKQRAAVRYSAPTLKNEDVCEQAVQGSYAVAMFHCTVPEELAACTSCKASVLKAELLPSTDVASDGNTMCLCIQMQTDDQSFEIRVRRRAHAFL